MANYDSYVIICTHNGEKYIGQQLKSIIEQSYLINKIIIFDFASTDNTLSELERCKYMSDDVQIIYESINFANGACNSFFYAINQSKKYIDNIENCIVYLSDQDEQLLGSKEVFFRLIIFLNTEIFSSNFTVFLLLFAVLGVSIKIFALVKLSPLPVLSIVLYLLSYFWLHEYIQIRAGVATAIFLLATKDLADGNFKKYFFKTFLSIMFHWSSIVMIAIYFLVKYKNLKAYALLPIIGIILNILNINFYLVIEFMLNTMGIDPIFYQMYAGYQNEINISQIIP